MQERRSWQLNKIENARHITWYSSKGVCVTSKCTGPQMWHIKRFTHSTKFWISQGNLLQLLWSDLLAILMLCRRHAQRHLGKELKWDAQRRLNWSKADKTNISRIHNQRVMGSSSFIKTTWTFQNGKIISLKLYLPRKRASSHDTKLSKIWPSSFVCHFIPS